MVSEETIKLICQYEWLRELADNLEVMSSAVDRCLIDLEFRLPDYYQYPGDLRSQKNDELDC